MLHPDLKKLAAPVERSSAIIWFAFFFGPVVYGVIAWVLTEGGTRTLGTGGESSLLLYILILISLVNGIVFPWVFAPRIAGVARMAANPGTAPTTFDGERAQLYQRLGDRDQHRARHLNAVQNARTVQWSFVESVAVFGLMALLLGQTGMYGAWIFALVSMGLMLLLRPNVERDLEEL